jgi:hypothetical protein
MKKLTAHNRRLAKKRVQWLIEALCFYSSSVLADSLELRNPLLRQAPKRYHLNKKAGKPPAFSHFQIINILTPSA